MKVILKSLFARWKIIAHKIGEFQSRLILSVFYFVIFAPFALGLRMFSDPLQLRQFYGWTARNDGEGAPEENSRRQF
jgi:hypothetical protein